MKKTIFADVLAAASMAALALIAAPALAAPAVVIDSSVQVERPAANGDANAAAVLEAPKDVVPGDRLVFAVSYTNAGEQPVDNFVVTNPIPAAVALAAEDGGFELSVDNGKTFKPRIAGLTVADAAAGTRPAQLTDVTHIRWVLPRLAPGARGAVTYKAIVR